MGSARSGLGPIPLARPPEFVVCPLMREIRAFRYFWPSPRKSSKPVSSSRDARRVGFMNVACDARCRPQRNAARGMRISSDRGAVIERIASATIL
jgi:hypothetical protein